MILKGFKQKSIKKRINKLLSVEHENVNNDTIESIGVILNIDEIDDFEWFNGLATHLNVHLNKLKIIAFSANKKETLKSWDVCFDPKDFGWFGAIKNSELQAFLDTRFDALISYYEADVTELKLLTALSKAKFKIGISGCDERLNDLIIHTNLKEFNVFKAEVFKYLTILNKIKNE
ncbi:DUF6913 domain-containing protein [Mariniflexile sp.]|uniref:DUF6913 domain-containing protein n=1 Tax=Mariniflexile sp. TaxID=1979402 RepID=UPI004047D635